MKGKCAKKKTIARFSHFEYVQLAHTRTVHVQYSWPEKALPIAQKTFNQNFNTKWDAYADTVRSNFSIILY